MQLGIGHDLKRVALNPQFPYRLASVEEVLALRPELRPHEKTIVFSLEERNNPGARMAAGAAKRCWKKNFPGKKKLAAKGDALTASFSSSDNFQSLSSSPLDTEVYR
jgi:hypothetical protein